MLRKSLFLLPTVVDANERRPQVWAAMLTGTTLGLVWGMTARLWMRIVSSNPELPVSAAPHDSAIILVFPTVFGTCAGLAFAARRRGLTSWRQYLPQTLTVAFFVALGFGGGMPMRASMLTVLLATLAVTWPVVPRIVIAVLWLLILVVAAAGGALQIGLVLFVTLPALYVARKLVALRASEHGMQSLKRWLSRIARASLLFLAAVAFVGSSVEIMTVQPGLLGPAYVVMYLLLLYPLFLGLRIALQPVTQPIHCEVEGLSHQGDAT